MNQTDKKTVFLIVLDGWGYRKESLHNAIASAHKPFFDSLWEKYPHALLHASGEYVGLPKGQMGDSEIGHHVMGAGRVPESDLTRISLAIQNGEFAKSPSFAKLFAHIKKHHSTLHVEGMLGPGGIHSHTDHLYAFLRVAKEAGIPRIAIHIFTDGHDTPPQSAGGYILELQKFLDELGVGFIATITGRYFAMDRDDNWDRVKRAEEALFECKGNVCHLKSGDLLIDQLYQGKETDDNLIEPIVCLDEKNNACGIQENDGVFFFNFRPDRARMLSRLTMERALKSNVYFVTMTEYDANLKTDVVFSPEPLSHTLGEEIAASGLRQAHIAESEKFAHATYFLNGGRQEPYAGEEDILVQSIKELNGKPIRSNDEVPEMRAEGIADEALKHIEKSTDFVFVNFANADMVGHTGNEEATKRAVEAVDRALARIVPALLAKGGVALITADHGNAEMNVDPANGQKHTSHTLNPVPVILTREHTRIKDGSLVNIAPTILSLLGIAKPQEMTGDSLIIE
ncbi:MAG: 2,3-bisphosphoglycerate-independent phosphoglycerate mutase [bacterium]|nr:2,3-bisphosphoglycerate-independent phosphoglycerate mutase [bacterium]